MNHPIVVVRPIAVVGDPILEPVPMVDAIVEQMVVRIVVFVDRKHFPAKSNQQTTKAIHNHHETDHHNYLGHYCIASILLQMLEFIDEKKF